MRPVSELLPDIEWAPLAPFWSACGQHELRFPRCVYCGRYQWYPRDFCAVCMGEEFDWEAVDPTGFVYSYTVVRRAFLPGSGPSVPFTVLQVQFDHVPGVTLLTNLADEAEAPRVHVGSRVVVDFIDVEHPHNAGLVSMPYMRLDESG